MRAKIHSSISDLAQQHSEVMLGFCQASVSCSDLFIGAHFKTCNEAAQRVTSCSFTTGRFLANFCLVTNKNVIKKKNTIQKRRNKKTVHTTQV